MKKRTEFSVFAGWILGISWLFLSLESTAQCSKYEPANGKKLFIIGQDLFAVGGYPPSNNNGYYENVCVTEALPVPAGVTTYTSTQYAEGLSTPASYCPNLWVHANAYTSTTLFNNTFIVIGLYMVGDLDNVTSGLRNANIDALALWIKSKAPRPVFLRIGYEFNYVPNAYDPVKYQNAYRHIVNRLRITNTVTNCAYVWQSDGGGTYNDATSSDILRWYPGDSYVDWLAYSHFYTSPSMWGWSILSMANDKNKPVMIAEATPIQGNPMSSASYDLNNLQPGQDPWNQWYAPFFSHIYTYDKIKAVAYINDEWNVQCLWAGTSFGDTRVQVNATVKASWVLEMKKPVWVHASATLLTDLTNASSCLLPVDLIDFKVQRTDDQRVEISWATTSETNHKAFTLLRSSDGINFVSIKYIPSQGNSGSLKLYKTEDPFPLTGFSFYKLLQEDWDGQATYSSIVALDPLAIENRVEIFPNPVKDRVQLRFISSAGDKVQLLEVRNVSGQILRQYLVNDELSEMELDLRDFPEGLYLLRVSDTANGVFQAKIVKLP